jgi:medium-chain acyl-[acyl-carrier-protein] hydrolase
VDQENPAGGARYERQFAVRAYEMGPGGRAKLGSLLNYFQEAASEHAERLGVSVTDLISRNLTWVLSRYHIRILRYPLWKETLRLATWPSFQERLFALREFELTDAESRAVAAATTSWMLLDLKTKRPVPPALHLPEYPRDPHRAIPDAFGPLPEPRKVDLELNFRVERRDLDWNRHVNHVIYVEWAAETVPRDILENFLPAEIEVDFRGQALLEDSVVSRTEIVASGDEPRLAHQIIKEQSGKELTRLRTLWRRN